MSFLRVLFLPPFIKCLFIYFVNIEILLSGNYLLFSIIDTQRVWQRRGSGRSSRFQVPFIQSLVALLLLMHITQTHARTEQLYKHE